MAIRQNSDGSYYADEVPGQTWSSLAEAQAAVGRAGPGPTASTMPLTAAPTGASPTSAAQQIPSLFAEYNQIAGATQPFIEGPLGQSPVLNQAVEQFKSLTQPVIQNQFTLQGLGKSPAVGQAMGVSLGNALVPLISQDMQNRLSAINLGQQRVGGRGDITLRADEQAQLGALRGAQVADASQGRQLQALGLAGQFGQYAGNQMSSLSDMLRQRQEMALQGFGSAGDTQRNVQQQSYDSAYQDYLRRQGLSEQMSTGLFGGSVLPPTINQASRTRTSSSK